MTPARNHVERSLALIVALLCAASCGSCEGEAPSVEEQDTAVRVETPRPDVGGPCGGCVDDGGDCQSGDEATACGAGGGECVACEGTDVCLEDGSCGVPPECAPGNCDGCCDAGGVCLGGDEAAACGDAGAACSACGAGTMCDAGVCMAAACGPGNCDGCCDLGGACVAGAADAVCGAGGGLCADCTATASTCNAGTCAAPQSCAASCQGCCEGESCVMIPDAARCGSAGAMCIACMAGEACTNGACAPIVGPTGNGWNIILISANIAPTKPDGSGWDFAGGLPDPYLEIYTFDSLGYWENYSGLFVDTLQPVWNELMLAGVTAEAFSEGIEFWFQDDDGFPDDICYDVLFVDPVAMANQDIVTTCIDDARTTYTWRIEPTP